MQRAHKHIWQTATQQRASFPSGDAAKDNIDKMENAAIKVATFRKAPTFHIPMAEPTQKLNLLGLSTAAKNDYTSMAQCMHIAATTPSATTPSDAAKR